VRYGMRVSGWAGYFDVSSPEAGLLRSCGHLGWAFRRESAEVREH